MHELVLDISMVLAYLIQEKNESMYKQGRHVALLDQALDINQLEYGKVHWYYSNQNLLIIVIVDRICPVFFLRNCRTWEDFIHISHFINVNVLITRHFCFKIEPLANYSCVALPFIASFSSAILNRYLYLDDCPVPKSWSLTMIR